MLPSDRHVIRGVFVIKGGSRLASANICYTSPFWIVDSLQKGCLI